MSWHYLSQRELGRHGWHSITNIPLTTHKHASVRTRPTFQKSVRSWRRQWEEGGRGRKEGGGRSLNSAASVEIETILCEGSAFKNSRRWREKRQRDAVGRKGSLISAVKRFGWRLSVNIGSAHRSSTRLCDLESYLRSVRGASSVRPPQRTPRAERKAVSGDRARIGSSSLESLLLRNELHAFSGEGLPASRLSVCLPPAAHTRSAYTQCVCVWSHASHH